MERDNARHGGSLSPLDFLSTSSCGAYYTWRLMDQLHHGIIHHNELPTFHVLT